MAQDSSADNIERTPYRGMVKDATSGPFDSRQSLSLLPVAQGDRGEGSSLRGKGHIERTLCHCMVKGRHLGALRLSLVAFAPSCRSG